VVGKKRGLPLILLKRVGDEEAGLMTPGEFHRLSIPERLQVECWVLAILVLGRS